MLVVAARRLDKVELDEIRSAFGLSEVELAGLFGVSRQAIAKWRTRGVPYERCADVARLRQLAEYFHRRFRSERVPQIVRNPGKGLRGKSVLETIAERGVDPVYAYLERLFAYTLS
jgi:transcriptional regulator with XRE-family HTH domain